MWKADCVANLCACPNGVPLTWSSVSGSQDPNDICDVNGGKKCKECLEGFHFDDEVKRAACVINQCTCPGGIPKTGQGCKPDGSTVLLRNSPPVIPSRTGHSG